MSRSVADSDDLSSDNIADLTDRRRLLLRAVFGVDVDPGTATAVFDPAPRGLDLQVPSSSTIRSGGRYSRTFDR